MTGRAIPRVRPILRAVWVPVVLIVALAAVTWSVDAFGSAVTGRVATTMLINVVVVGGIYVFVGNSGIVSFGHISFMAIGAYVAALLTLPEALKRSLLPDLPGALGFLYATELAPVAAVIAGGAVAALVAALAAAPLMRLAPVALGISTLALLVIVNVIVSETETVTRGRSTMIGVPMTTQMWDALGWAAITVVVAYAYQESRRGLFLRASRESDEAARSLGIRVPFERGVAFILSGFLVGAGGALYAQYLGTFGPDAFYLSITITTLVMLVIGGLQSLSGAVIGVLFITVVTEALRRIEISGLGPVNAGALGGLTEVILALVLLITLILRPGGITAGREIPLPRRLG